jgi:leucyl aminopeptidase
MPLTENLVDAHSYKVGDVVSTREGKTVEILNTDAEGRLILADALSYIRSYRNIDYLVDIATLTGAIVTSLGHFCTGAMTNDQEFFNQVEKAGQISCEKIWQLPLFDDYMAQIQSDIADYENTGGSPAGSITAAIFLKQFVGNVPWVHLDIAGTAWMDESTMTYMKNPFLPKEGGTGAGTRLLYHLAKILSEN